MRLIDPATVLLGRPIYAGSTPQHEASMLTLVESRSIGAQYMHAFDSSISTARDYITHHFLTRTRCEWLQWIDADISFSLEDWNHLMEHQGGELAVCAEYLTKTQDLTLQVANFGLGFARVHRSVYEQLDNLTREDGEPRLLRYRGRVLVNGQYTWEEFTEYHPIGVHPDGSRRNEDHGFWLMVRLAGIPIRIETRTKLGHTGSFTWWYDAEKIAAARAKAAAADFT